MKKGFFLFIGIIVSYIASSQQQNDSDRGIYESFVILKKNGGGNVYYDLQTDKTSNPNFEGSLGVFGAGCSLIISGGENKTYTCNGCILATGTFFYRIYPSGESAPNFSEFTLGLASNDAGGCGGNQTWRNDSESINVLHGRASGTYVIEILTQNPISGGCPGLTLFSNNNSANYKATFTIVGPPTIQTSASVCLGSSVTLTGSCESGTPKWSTGEIAAVISVSPTINTTYTATCKTAEGCESLASSSVTVTVNSLSIIDHPITQFDCEPNSIRFLANASTTSTGMGSSIIYKWQRKLATESSFTGLSNTLPTLFYGNILQVSPTGSPNISGTQFRYIATDGNGCSVTSNPATLHLNNVGTITNNSVCENTDYTLTLPISPEVITNVLSYQWEVLDATANTWENVSNGGGISGATTQSLNFTRIPSAQDGKKYRCKVVFNVSVNNDNDGSINQGAAITCTRTSAEVTLNVKLIPPIPIINTISPQNVCLGESITLNSTGCSGVGGTTSWYENDALVSSTAIYKFTPLAVSSKSYKARCTKSGCESSFSTNIVVNINPVPIVSAVTINPASAVVCQGNNVALTLAKELVTNKVRWYNQAVGGAAVSSSSATTTNSHTYNIPLSVILPINSITPNVLNYWVEQENTYGCISPRTQKSFTVNPIPSAPSVTSPVNYCQNSPTISLSATPTGSNSLFWYGTSASGGISSGSATIPISSFLGTTSYYVSQKNSYTCESTRSSINVVVNSIPNAPVAPTTISYCKNNISSALSAAATGANILIWYDVNDNILGSAPTPNTTIVGVQIFKVSQKSPAPSNCESPKTTITVTINDLPPAPSVTDAVGYCKNASATALSATAMSTNALLWYGTNAVGGTASGTSPTPITTSAGTTAYYVSQVDANKCESLRAKIDVEITPSVSATISGINAFCMSGVLNKSTTLTVNPTGGNGSYTYQWQNLSGNINSAIYQTYEVNNMVQAGNSETFKVILTSGYCITSANLNVTKQGWSDVPSVSINPIGDICGNGSKTLSINSPNAGTYKWYEDANSLTQIAAGTIFSTPNLTSTKSYYVAREQQITANLTCQTDRTVTTVNVNLSPETPIIVNSANKTRFCNTDSGFSLSVSCTSGSGQYRLNNGAWTSGNLISITPANYTSSITLDYDFICSLNASCQSAMSSTSVTISSAPNAPMISGNTNICSGTSTNLSASGCLGTVVWSNGTSANDITVSTSGIYYATCTLGGCTSVASLTQTTILNAILPAPTVISDDIDNIVCAGTNVKLSVSDCAGTVVWSNGIIATTILVSASGTYNATCTVNGCTSVASTTQTIVINQNPAISLGSINSVCNTATSVDLPFNTISNNPDKYILTSNMTGFMAVYDAPLSASPIRIYIPSGQTGNHSFVLSIKNSITKCTNSQTFDLTVLPVLIAGSIENSSNTINCSGYNAGVITNMSLASGGKTNYIYQWQSSTDNVNYIDISGANLTTYDPPALTQTTYYRRKVKDACGDEAISSNVHRIQIVSDPQITITDVTDRIICSGSNFSIQATVIGGSGTCTPIWQSSSTQSGTYINEQVGGLSFTAFLTNATNAPTAKYYRAIYACSGAGSGACNQGFSSVVKVSINPNPNTPTITPFSSIICPSQSTTLTASGCNGIVLWGGGQTGSTLSISEPGTYVAKCTLNSCISASSSVKVTLASGGTPITPPVISGSATICSGVFTNLIASNCSGSINWSNGQTGTSIRVNPLNSTDYTATCFDGTCTSNSSNKITVTVNSFPIIATQPKNQSDCNGNSVTFTVASTSITNYQWQRKNSNGVFTDIANAVSNTLTISNVGSIIDPNQTEYRVAVSNGNCSVTSNVAVLTVNSIVGSLVDQTICDGANVSFNLSNISILGSIQSYQWQRRLETSGTWNDIAGATTNTLKINAATNADEQYYRCKVNFTAGGSTCARYTTEDDSNGAKLTVLVASTPTISGTNAICKGTNTTLTANNCEGIIIWSSGQSTANITVSPVVNTSYTVSCTSTQCGFIITSAPYSVAVSETQPPEIITYDVILPATLTFAARTTVPNATLMWYNRATSGIGTSTAPSFSAVGTYSYWVTQTNPITGCESARLPIIAKVLDYFHISQQPTNQVDCKGNSVFLSVIAVGPNPTFTYQWQRKRPNELDFVNLVEEGNGIKGWYARTMTVSNVGNINNPDKTQYRCIVSNNGEFITSEISTLTVNSLEGSMPNLGVCVGGDNEFNLQNYFLIKGNVVNYQWQTRLGTSGAWTDLNDGNGISGSNKSILKFINTTHDQSAYYRCLVKFNTQGFECTESTDAAKLIVSGFPPAPLVSRIFYCQNANTVRLKVDSPNQNLVWYSQETEGVGNKTAPTPNSSIAGVFKYYVADRTNEGCEGPRSTISVEIGATPASPKNTTPTSVNEGNLLTMSAEGNPSESQVLRWYTSPTITTFSITAPSFTSAGTYTRYVAQVSPFGCVGPRTPITATIIPSLKFTKQPLSQADCEGNSVTFAVSAIAASTITYQWQRQKPNETIFKDLPNANSNLLKISDIGNVENPDLTKYRCLIKDDKNSMFSEEAILTVNQIVGALETINLCDGKAGKLTFNNLSITGKTAEYQWQKKVLNSYKDIPTNSNGEAVINEAGTYRGKITYIVDKTLTCYRTTTDVKVEVKPIPTAPQVANQNACLNTPIDIAQGVTSINSLLWYETVTDTTGDKVIPKIDFTKLGKTIFFVSQINNFGCESERKSFDIIVSAIPEKPITTDLSYCRNAISLALTATTTTIQNRVLWYPSLTAKEMYILTPTPSTKLDGEFTYFASSKNTVGCESERVPLNVSVASCIATFESNFNNCMQVSADSVKGNQWFDLYDKTGRLYASVNPNGLNLGKVSISIRHYGRGSTGIPTTQNDTKLMARYVDFQSSLLNEFDSPVSLRIYYLNDELNDYKAATNLPNLTINDFNIVHYDGIREDCGFENNDNFVEGESYVIYKNIIGNQIAKDFFYLEFDVKEFSEIGATANDYTEIVLTAKETEKQTVQLNWKSKFEIKAEKYIVERSNDCKNFTKISEVKAKGTSSFYENIDFQPMSGKNCYRLVYIDKDGTKKFLDTIELNFTGKDPVCSVFPNPWVKGDEINLYLRNIKEKEIKLYDMLGQEFSFKMNKNEAQIIKIRPDVHLSKGIHFVVVVGEDEKKCVQKVVINP